MKNRSITLFEPFWLLFKLVLLVSFNSYGQNFDNNKNLSLKYWEVEGVKRKAIVYIPDKDVLKNTPLIFIWHGHGGSAENFIKRFPLYNFLKNSIIVYPQGINSKSPRDINAERTGWQHQIGDYNDRDVKFFDIMYSFFSNNYSLDIDKVYCTGSSNGGAFTYILLQLRPDIFSSAAPVITANTGVDNINKMNLPSIPIFHISGKKEKSFKKQEKIVNYIIKKRKANHLGYWKGNIDTKHYASKNGDIIWFTHPDGHRWRTIDTKLIADFFTDSK